MKTIFVLGLILWVQQGPAQVSTLARLRMADDYSRKRRSVATAERASPATASIPGPYRQRTRKSGSGKTAGIRSFCLTEAMTARVEVSAACCRTRPS